MRLPFRQGIVRYQTDNNLPTPAPAFLQQSSGGSTLDLIIAPDPTIITFAHGNDHDYLFEETLSVIQAWTGPFISGTDYWVYWDIDVLTAARTFGHTTIQPVSSNQMPSAPVENMHWFDKTNNLMKVYTNGFFVETLRVFAAKYASGTVIQYYQLGSQVGLNVQSTPGTILFDESGDPIRQGKNRRVGRFVHTETNFSTHASSGSVVKLEASVEMAQAVVNIAAYQTVSYYAHQQVGYGSSTDTARTIIGITQEALFVGEVGTFITKGYITNPFWNWTQPAGTYLYSDPTGQITTDVPQIGAFQRIGQITSPTAILVDIGPKYIIE
jgi:hypothetical protein